MRGSVLSDMSMFAPLLPLQHVLLNTNTLLRSILHYSLWTFFCTPGLKSQSCSSNALVYVVHCDHGTFSTLLNDFNAAESIRFRCARRCKLAQFAKRFPNAHSRLLPIRNFYGFVLKNSQWSVLKHTFLILANITWGLQFFEREQKKCMIVSYGFKRLIHINIYWIRPKS